MTNQDHLKKIQNKLEDLLETKRSRQNSVIAIAGLATAGIALGVATASMCLHKSSVKASIKQKAGMIENVADDVADEVEKKAEKVKDKAEKAVKEAKKKIK